MAIDILNSSIGIGQVLPQAGSEHLPDIERFSSVGSAADLSAVAAYKAAMGKNGFARTALSAFIPQVSSDELLKPAVFNRHLQSAEEKLAAFSQDRSVRAFVHKDLQPLRENRELLQAFLGMMVEG